jgi:hypothetical protein
LTERKKEPVKRRYLLLGAAAAPFKERAFICRCSLSGFSPSEKDEQQHRALFAAQRRFFTAKSHHQISLFGAALRAGWCARSNTWSGDWAGVLRKTHGLIMKYHFLSVAIVNTAAKCWW